MSNHHAAPPDDLGMAGLLYIPDIAGIDQCWALDNHMVAGERTQSGRLAFEAKHYGNKPGDAAAAERLGAALGWWYRRLTSSQRHRIELSLIVPVPSLRQRWPHNLPEVLARGIAEAVRVRTDPTALVVCKTVPEMKHIPAEQRPSAVSGAFAAPAPVGGAVLLVDDLLQSGSTLSECARVLRAAGATSVTAACATRATKGMRPLPARPAVALVGPT